MSSEWVVLVPSLVFTRIKSSFSEEIKATYNMKDKNFSTKKTKESAVFPFVYVHLLPAVEQGQDLEGNNINAGLFTFQIEVYDNQSHSRARAVMGEVLRIMKSMRFDCIALPEIEDGDTIRCVSRFRRIIGSGDVL